MPAPASFMAWYDKNPDVHFIEYLAEIMSDPSQVTIFKDSNSLCSQPNFVVPINEIRSGKDLIPNRLGGKEILQISSSTVLKVGWTVRMNEAETLILLSTKTAVPVPKVITAYTIGDIGFILMSKIDGETLGSCWDDISQEQHKRITRELKTYVGEWRKLRSSFLGSVNGGPCEDIIFKHPFDYKAPPKYYGPFPSLQDYKTGVIEALHLSIPDGVWDETAERAKELIWTFANTEGSISCNLGVMTHGDLHPGNIMIHDGSVSVIVDWSEAGYSLPGRESFAARRIATDPSWIDLIPCFIPIFPEEYALWDEVDRVMRRYSPC